MSPTLTCFGDDRRDRNLSSPYRHRYRHHLMSSGGKGLQKPVTMVTIVPNLYAERPKTHTTHPYIYKGWRLSSPIVTETRLTLEKKGDSAVTMAVTMQKTGFYRHPHRHRSGVCNGEATP